MSDPQVPEPGGSSPGDLDTDEAVDVEPEVLWTSDEALTFDEARRLTSRRGATVVLFAGDADAGKTTAMVEIWTSLLTDGTLGDAAIAGSSSALAFERRSFESRIESGMNTTKRTDEEGEGFLHLSVLAPRGRIELLFGDFPGEHFTRIREGTEAIEELPWIGRVDRLVVFVDGGHVASPAAAEVAFTRARRFLWKIRDCVDRNPNLRVSIVLSKADLVDETRAADFAPFLEQLRALVNELDPEGEVWSISARPGTGGDPEGLEHVLDWVCMIDRVSQEPDSEPDTALRAMGRYQ